jgi:PhnB protein
MQLNPYLNFNGQCAEAFKFYEQCLAGSHLVMMTHGESPMAEQTSPAWRDQIIHARLTVGDRVLMGCDAPPEYFQAAQGFWVSVGVGTPAAAENIFSALGPGRPDHDAAAADFLGGTLRHVH